SPAGAASARLIPQITVLRRPRSFAVPDLLEGVINDQFLPNCPGIKWPHVNHLYSRPVDRFGVTDDEITLSAYDTSLEGRRFKFRLAAREENLYVIIMILNEPVIDQTSDSNLIGPSSDHRLTIRLPLCHHFTMMPLNEPCAKAGVL